HRPAHPAGRRDRPAPAPAARRAALGERGSGQETGENGSMSDIAVLTLDALVKSAIIILILLTGFAYTTVLERRFIARLQSRIGPNRAGPWGLLQPVADGIKLFFKEDLIPANADKVIFTLAPAITAIPALIVLAVVPFGEEVNLFGYRTPLGLRS